MSEIIRNQLKERIKGLTHMGIVPPLEKLIIDHGETFKPRKYMGILGEAKNCFCNALHHALAMNLYYCEGFAISGKLLTSGLPLVMEHAWCCDEEGNVEEPTWEDGENSLYLGLRFKAREACRRVMAKGTYGVFYSSSCMYDLKYIEKINTIEEKKNAKERGDHRSRKGTKSSCSTA